MLVRSMENPSIYSTDSKQSPRRRFQNQIFPVEVIPRGRAGTAAPACGFCSVEDRYGRKPNKSSAPIQTAFPLRTAA